MPWSPEARQAALAARRNRTAQGEVVTKKSKSKSPSKPKSPKSEPAASKQEAPDIDEILGLK